MERIYKQFDIGIKAIPVDKHDEDEVIMFESKVLAKTEENAQIAANVMARFFTTFNSDMIEYQIETEFN